MIYKRKRLVFQRIEKRGILREISPFVLGSNPTLDTLQKAFLFEANALVKKKNGEMREIMRQ
jgi:hypothetical protein